MITGEELFIKFQDALNTDDEPMNKKGNRLINTYNGADNNGKKIIDDIFITLCGWSLETLIK